MPKVHQDGINLVQDFSTRGKESIQLFKKIWSQKFIEASLKMTSLQLV